MSKKIAVFTLAYEPFVGGAEIAAKEIIKRSPNFNFTIFTKKFDRSWSSQETKNNFQLLRLGRGDSKSNYYGNFIGKLIYVWRAWRSAEAEHRKHPFSAVWAIMASYAGFAALFFKLCHPRIPFILTLQEGDSEAHILRRVGILYPLWRAIFKKADKIQAISRYLGDFARRHGARPDVVVLNPNGVDLNLYRQTNVTSGPTFKVVTTSRLVRKNGVDILIRAFAKISEPGVVLDIVGGGPEELELKKLAQDLKISERVHFLGQIDPDKIPEKLMKANLFVRVSRSEGLGNSFLEAMAAGLPVIGTPVGGIPDILTDGVTGLLVKAEDPDDLADKISRIKNNKELANKLSESGRQMVHNEYSWDIIAAKMNLVFFKPLCA